MANLEIVLEGQDRASGPIGNVNKSLGNLDKQRDTVGKGLGGLNNLLGTGLKVAAGAAIGGLGLLAGAIGGVSAAALGVALDFDDAVDAIHIATGATGADLDAMGESARNLKASTFGLGHDFETIGQTLGEVSSRTGLTGGALEELTADILEFSRVTGGDAVQQTELLTRTMGDWSVATEDSGMLLDQIFGASQAFGIGVDDLAGKLVTFGAPLRQMGFSIEESIAMFGKWEEEGVNAELVIGSLRIAAGKFAKDGVDLAQGLKDVQERIKGAATESEGLSIAMEVFGARAGPDMAAAIREGRFELDSAIEALRATEGGLRAAGEGTLGFKERWQVNMAKMQDALLPIGVSLMGLADKLMPVLASAVDSLIPRIEALGEWFGRVAEEIAMILESGSERGFGRFFEIFEDGSTRLDRLFEAFGMTNDQAQEMARNFINGAKGFGKFMKAVVKGVKAVGSFVDRIGGLETILKIIGALFAAKIIIAIVGFVGSIVSAVSAIAGFIGAVGGIVLALNPITLIIAGVVAALVGLYLAWQNNFLGIQDIVRDVWGAISGWFSNIAELFSGLDLSLGGIGEMLSDLGAAAMSAIGSGFESAKQGVATAFTTATAWVKNNLNWSSLQTAVQEGGKTVFAKLGEGFEAAKQGAVTAWKVAQAFVEAGQAGALPGWLQKVFDFGKKILEELGKAWEAVKVVTKAVFKAAIDWILNIDWNAVFQAMLDFGRGILEALGEGILDIRNFIGSLIEGAVGFVTDLDLTETWNRMIAIGKAILTKVWEGVTAVWGGIRSNVAQAINFITDLNLTGIWDRMKGIGAGILNSVWRGISDIWVAIRDNVGAAINFITDIGSPLAGIWERMQGIGRGILNSVWRGVTDVWSTIRGNVANAINFITDLDLSGIWDRMKAYGAALLSKVWEGITSIWNAIRGNVASAINHITNLDLSGIWERMKSYGAALLSKVWEGVASIWDTIKGNVASAFNHITSLDLGGIWERMKSYGATLLNKIWEGVTSVWNTTRGNIASAINFITDFDLSGIWERMKGIGKAILTAVGGGIAEVKELIRGAVGGAINFITDLGGALNGIWERMQGIGKGILTAVGSGIASVRDTVVGVLHSALNFMADMDLNWLWEELRGIGKGIITAIGSGIASARELLKQALQTVASALPQWVKDILGISSPSKVFIEIGHNIMAGWTKGLEDMASLPQQAMAGATGGVVAGATSNTNIDNSRTNNWNVTVPTTGRGDRPDESMFSLVNTLTAVYG